MPENHSSQGAVLTSAAPPLKEPEVFEKPKKDIKPGTAEKKEGLPEKREKEEKNSVSAQSKPVRYEDIKNRKKIKIGEESYYVVSLEEISQYMDLKDTYKTDAMSAFIVYIHQEFISDLKKLRAKSSRKTRLIIIAVIFTLIILALVVVGLSMRS